MTNEYIDKVLELLADTPERIEQRLSKDPDPERRLKYRDFCQQLVSSPYWKELIEEVRESQREYATMNAREFDEVMFSRAIIVATTAIDTMMKEHAKEFSEKNTTPIENKEESHQLFDKPTG